jgi:predicted helicase
MFKKTKAVKPQIKILDEVHHLVSIKEENQSKTFNKCLEIETEKQLGLTATLKYMTSEKFGYKVGSKVVSIISNDNKDIFGDVITERSLNWSINRNIICDYVLQTIFLNTNNADYKSYYNEYEIKNDEDKKLFLSAYFSLKSINDKTRDKETDKTWDKETDHLLIYSNNTINCDKITNYITKLKAKNNLFDNIKDLYCSSYKGNQSSIEQKEILSKFESSKQGIISCVYCLGEGWDFPLLDGVVFAENMSSEIRIVQSALRASRKNKNNTSKIAKIIIPIFTDKIYRVIDEINDNNSFRSVLNVINQMNIVDENIIQKISCNFDNYGKESNGEFKEEGELEDLTDELNLKKFKDYVLQNIKRDNTISYKKTKEILKSIIPRIDSKESYLLLCEIDTRFIKNPEDHFKSQFINWIDYLSIERLYYDLETCKTKVYEYLSNKQLKDFNFDFTVITKYLKSLDDNFKKKGKIFSID